MIIKQPDPRGHFGQFGGRYVAETLMPALLELEESYKQCQADPLFQSEFEHTLKIMSVGQALFISPQRSQSISGGQDISEA